VQGPFSNDDREWLEPDGLGGFASGTVSGVRTRRYHALLLTATTPPTGRMVLVNGFDAWIETDHDRVHLTSQRYAPGVISPDGASRITGFTLDPWPAWTFTLPSGARVVQEVFVPHGRAAVVAAWRLEGSAGDASVRLVVRPFLSGRDYHGLHHENPACRTEARVDEGLVRWNLYDGVPQVASLSNGRFTPEVQWYRDFLYSAESDRGLDDREDLVSPGTLTFDLSGGEALWLLETGAPTPGTSITATVASLRRAERERRSAFATGPDRAADAYFVGRGEGQTVIAGYPWFTDWGRDTFIAMRGLCFATGRYDEARQILLQWSDTVSLGMLPNRFADAAAEPEFNSVDASLWFVVAVRELLEAAAAGHVTITPSHRQRLLVAVTEILEGYSAGTRFGIRLDTDGLLACGEPGVQLTWMDAKVGDWVVTPRAGKPVEIQALWLHALEFASTWDARWQVAYVRGRISFARKFWNPNGLCLYDVVDVDHVAGRVDASFRPNQIFAIGGLGVSLLDTDRTRIVLGAIERKLLTPLGLRSLAPDEAGYAPVYRGGPRERDGAYHQGTVWPWLIGPFVDAWLAARGRTDAAKAEARQRFLVPLEAHLDDAGLGHVSEIADAEPPFTPRGCPFQAWSLGEMLRLRAATEPRSGVGHRGAEVPEETLGIGRRDTEIPEEPLGIGRRGTEIAEETLGIGHERAETRKETLGIGHERAE
jgi:predicted glycogen debranching enzyme